MTIFLQFFRLSASFCPGTACPAVGPQAAQILRQVGIAAPDMSGIQHPHAAPVPHTKARQHQCCPAPQVWCSHSGTMQFCAAAKVQQPSLAAGISPQGGKALRTGYRRFFERLRGKDHGGGYAAALPSPRGSTAVPGKTPTPA